MSFSVGSEKKKLQFIYHIRYFLFGGNVKLMNHCNMYIKFYMMGDCKQINIT
jgi:hypothetical protein